MHRLFLLTFCWLSLLSGCQPARSRDVVPTDYPAPDFTAPLLNGDSFQLSKAYADNVVMLDFWATWCPPCRAELPVLIRIANDYKNQGVVLYTINQGEDVPTIREFLDESGWDIHVVLDSRGKISSLYQVDGIPHLVLVDRDGIVRHVHTGYGRGLEKELRQELDSMLGRQKSPR